MALQQLERGIRGTVAGLEEIFLNKATAVDYLCDPRVPGLTNRAVAQLDRMPAEDLVAGILLPAAREAYTQGTTDVFAQKAGGLADRWRRHHRSEADGRENPVTQLLLNPHVRPEDERPYSIALAHTVSMNDLLDNLEHYSQSIEKPSWKQEGFPVIKRLAEAISIKLTIPQKTHSGLNNLVEVNWKLNRGGLASLILNRLPIDDPDTAGVRNLIAIASIMAASEDELSHPTHLSADLLICALSDSRTDSLVTTRTADELVRRINTKDSERNDRKAMGAVLRHVERLPVSPETENIWRNLTEKVLNRIKDLGLTRGLVRVLAGRVNYQDYLRLDNRRDMMALVNGLERILEIPIEELRERKMEIADPLIGDEDATQLIRNLLNIYMTTQVKLEDFPLRNSILSLAATLSMGYTVQMTSDDIIPRVLEVTEKLDRDAQLFGYHDSLDGPGRFREQNALIILQQQAKPQNPGDNA